MLITPQRSIAPPPPCWCGRGWQVHQESPDRDQTPGRDGAPGHRQPSEPDAALGHPYVPADGIESETFDAW
jgi:hypothetical protein